LNNGAEECIFEIWVSQGWAINNKLEFVHLVLMETGVIGFGEQKRRSSL